MNAPQGLQPTLRLLLCTSAVALIGTARSLHAQAAPASQPTQPAPAATPAVPVTTTPGNGDNEIVTLSPFEVVENNKGYYATNTMSGTRFNTKLEDLAGPITVVTKEQMSDFAMLDINDIFAYTPGTEGTETYSDVQVNRNGDVTDNVQNSPNTANRVRGLSPANISFDNFEMSGRMAIDPTVTNGVEVSRGPNASVFGLGNPGGTVNQVPLTPNLTRDRNSTELRVDSYGGYRTSIDANRVLLNGKLAVRGTAAYQHDEFIRKPSGVGSERYNATIKFQPYKNTTITAGAFYYHTYGQRPNFTTPRDNITYWEQQGSPTWDPIAEVVHVNGQTLGPFTQDTSAIPDALQRTFTGSGHNYMYVDQNGVGYLGAPNTFGVSKGLLNPTTSNQTVRLFASNGYAGASLGKVGTQPLFATTPAVNNKALYDWSKINLASINNDWDTDLISTAKLDQVFLNTPTQTLAAQFSVMRENAHRYRRDFYGVSNDNGQSGQLLVDVNEKMLDGSPNPYFGRLYIGQDQPRTYTQPLKWDSYRAQLAYKLDLTQEKGWWKWLGMHEFTGYDEYKYRIQRQYSWREAILDDHSWIPAGISRANQGAVTGGPSAALSITRSYMRYYVSGPNALSVQYAPTEFKPGTYNFQWGSWNITNQTVNGKTYPLPSSIAQWNSEPSQIGLAAVTDSTGAGSNTKKILKTMGGLVQSHFLDDRIVTTFGKREDKQYIRLGSAPQQLIYPQGIAFNYDSIDHWAGGDWNFNKGMTTQAGVVVRPFRNLKALEGLNSSGAGGHFLAGLLDGLFLTLNKSNSFLPQDPKENLFFQQLPNTTSNSKDYGFGFTMFDGRLVVRYNHWSQQVINSRTTDASTIAQRVTRIDLSSNAKFLLYTQMYSTTATPAASSTSTDIGWIRMQNPGWSEQQVEDEVGREMGLPWNTIVALQTAFNNNLLATTQDQAGKGHEIEVNYVSPSRNLTIYGTAYSQEVVNSNMSNDVTTWINSRLPIWTTIRDPRDGALWWTKNYGGSQTAQANYDSFVRIPFALIQQQQGKVVPQLRKWNFRVLGKYALAGITDQRWLKNVSVGGAVRWEDKAAIGYYGVQDANGIYQSLDANRPIWDKAHTYYDSFVSYRTKLWANRIGATFQLNIKNMWQKTHLQAISAYPDGNPNGYRIIDPQTIIFTAAFDF